jgi:dienelactone hydrolase
MRGWYSSDDRDFGPETRNPASGQVTGTEEWQHETDGRSEKLADGNVVVWLYADHGADRKYVNSPLLYINPKGWKDAYRFPKYAYYLWQANFTTKPMAFILPTWWREQYVGQRKPITVDSNAAEVTLRVNGKVIGKAKPSAANNHNVTFDDVPIEHGTISVDGLYSLTMAGKPARLVMKASARRIPADRAGIAVLSVDIVDSAGVHVFGANPPLTWSVSGPATLAGPATFQSDTAKNGAAEGTLYIDAPVANVLRSTATSGSIKVRVTAPGLEPAEVTLESLPPAADRVEGILEPPVQDAGRIHVSRDARFKPVIVAAKNSKKRTVAQVEDHAAEDFRPQKAVLITKIKSTLFVPDPLPALATETYGTFEPAPGVVAERVSYATNNNLRVPAIVYRPAEKKWGGPPGPRPTPSSASSDPAPTPNQRVKGDKRPAFIVVNGHGGDKYSWYSFYTGILYAQAGAVVLTYDPIGEGERNAQRKDGTRQHDRNVDPPEMARRMAGLMITDIMQAVSYLSSRPDVDPKRIGAGGYSMGSFILSLAGAVETRLNSVVLVGGGNLDGAGGYWETSAKRMCQGIPYGSLAFLGDRAAAIYDLHAARGSTLIWNGAEDDVVAIPRLGREPFFEDLRQRTIAMHGSDKNVFDFGFTPGGSHRPYFITRPVALWLEERLHFPNWTRESIEKMPETHILEWAPAHSVPMDKLYFTEQREGGTRALGADIPAVPHDAMDALPRDRWEREKDNYVYESWLKNCRVGF